MIIPKENEDKIDEPLEVTEPVEEIAAPNTIIANAGSPNVTLKVEEPKDDAKDKFAKNDSSLRAKDKSYLSQFIIKPKYNVNESITTNVNPSPLDVGNAEYIDNPVVMTNLSPRHAEILNSGYNLKFEPYTTKYSNKG